METLKLCNMVFKAQQYHIFYGKTKELWSFSRNFHSVTREYSSESDSKSLLLLYDFTQCQEIVKINVFLIEIISNFIAQWSILAFT